MSPSVSPRAARLGRMLIRWVTWLIVFAAIIQLCIYANDVHTRKTRVPTCEWEPIESLYDPPYASPPYSGRFCYLVRGTILLQLYDASDQHLLAERMYSYPYYERPSFFWRVDAQRRPSALGYDTTINDEISLPPTLLDRLRAKLP